MSLFDNEPVSINTIRTRKTSKTSLKPKVSSNLNPKISSTPTQNEEKYGQFSTLRESKDKSKDIYRLHGQTEDGKNTQIIINLSNEPKSYVGYDKGSNQQDLFPKSSLVFPNSPLVDDFIGPPAPPPPTSGPPAPPPTSGPPAPPPSSNGPPAPPTPPTVGKLICTKKIHRGKSFQLPQLHYLTVNCNVNILFF